VNLQDTHRHWEKYEAIRREKLAEGKSEDEAHAAVRSAWNAWAQALLDERKAHEEAGTWEDNAAAWRRKADLTFSTKADQKLFRETSGFTGLIFPGNSRFECAKFRGLVDFSEVSFRGKVWLEQATFIKTAFFTNASFRDNACFKNTTFESEVRFTEARFFGTTSFETANFHQRAWLDGTKWRKIAVFSGSSFSGESHFINAKAFDEIIFLKAEFKARATFDAVKFGNILYSKPPIFLTTPLLLMLNSRLM
jgi:hypothetical protein